MKNLELVYYGHPTLRKDCTPVTLFDENLHKTIERMATIMYTKKGVGLAAPQIGIEKEIIIIDTGDDLTVLVNPVIVTSDGTLLDQEGCLSFPGLTAEIERPKYIKVSACNENGELFEIDGEGLFARAITHEKDHLSGKLFIDYLTEAKKLIYSRDLKTFQKMTMDQFNLKTSELKK